MSLDSLDDVILRHALEGEMGNVAESLEGLPMPEKNADPLGQAGAQPPQGGSRKQNRNRPPIVAGRPVIAAGRKRKTPR